MRADDSVLVGVINRAGDFAIVRDEGWYRIPVERAPRQIEVDYLAFFVAHSMKKLNSAIHFYAKCNGHELVRRRDLLPNRTKPSDLAKADDLYYKMAIGPLLPKMPPITNPTNRSIAFIHTTGDRFMAATTIADLYSKSDIFVERVARKLRDEGIVADFLLEADDPQRKVSELRIRCERGILSAIAGRTEGRTERHNHSLVLSGDDVDMNTARIREAVRALGGPIIVDVSPEG
jgi:hypothetical protein